MDYLITNANVVGGLASAASALIATIALVFAAMQIREAKLSAKETAAIQAMNSYFRNCSEKPHLGHWNLFKAWSPPHSTPAKLYAHKLIDEKSGEELDLEAYLKAETYLWFLAELLFMCELVLSSKAAGSMEKTLSTQIGYHAVPLRYLWERQDWREEYPPNVQAFVRKALKLQK